MKRSRPGASTAGRAFGKLPGTPASLPRRRDSHVTTFSVLAEGPRHRLVPGRALLCSCTHCPSHPYWLPGIRLIELATYRLGDTAIAPGCVCGCGHETTLRGGF
jgi:hypothetical protein